MASRETATLRPTRGWGMIDVTMDAVEPSEPQVAPGYADPEADTVIEGADEARPHEPLTPGTRLGRYVVLEELGMGGMGVVFAAYDPELNRKVALKLLRPRKRERKRSTGNRLLQEAQALAKLAHPNVITVYDVGTFGEQVFVAMELVEGTTLRGWLKEKPRRWAEVLEVFIPAGRGLAAAHAANLVHRDFKPENVLIGRDGRVRVMDFGLARPLRGETRTGHSLDSLDGFGDIDEDEDTDTVLDGASAAMSERAAADVADPLMTQTGSTLGTPAYMAPEQHLGKATDARSDQFSFCIALFHALFGVRPYDGEDAITLTKQKVEGSIVAPPQLGKVPTWVRRHVWRGLSPDATDRFVDMDGLLDALGRDPRIKRRKVGAALVATTAVVGSVGAIQYTRARGPAVCRDAQERVDAVWSESRKNSLAQALRPLEREAIDHSYQTAASALDAYGNAWTKMYTDACEATHLRGEQSARLLELRQSCLQERLDEIDAWATELSEPTYGTATRLAHAAFGLGRLSACADTEALASAVDPPQGDTLRDAVAALRADLARVKVKAYLGKFDEALALAQTTYDAAETVDYPPVFAEARFGLGRAQGMRGDLEEAEENLEEAQWKGASVKHDAIAAAAASELVHLVGRQRGDHEDGLGWSRHAEAAIKRIGSRGFMEARLRHDVGVLQAAAGRLDEAAADIEEALRLYETVPASLLHQIEATRSLAAVRLQNDQLDEATDLFANARSRSAEALGETHPEVARADVGLAQVLDARGQHTSALAKLEGALQTAEAAYGPHDPALVEFLEALARSHADRGAHRLAVEAKRKILKLERARLGEHPNVAQVFYDIGSAQQRAGDEEEARESLEQALALWEKARGSDHPDLAFALTSLGQLDITSAHAQRAVSRLERALKLRGGRGLDPALLAQTQFALARALHATGGDHPRARELATKARDTFAKGKSPDPMRSAAVDAWLETTNAAP